MVHLLLSISILLVGCFQTGFSEIPEYNEECDVWLQAIEAIKDEDNLEQVECTINPQCTGFDCQGHYHYSGLSTGWKKLDMDVCFGISLHPCHIPEPDLEIYVYIKDTNTSWQKNVSHSDLYPVEGVSYQFLRRMKYDGFMEVNMTNTRREDHRYMELELMFKMRQTIYTFEHWPEDFQMTLVPNMMVPVPDCSTDVLIPGHKPYTCGYTGPALSPGGGTKPTQITGDTSSSHVKTTPIPRSYLPGTPCVMSHSIQDLAVTCAPHQACRPLHGSDVSVCVCSNGFAYNTSDDTCYPASVDVLVDDPIIIPVPSASAESEAHLPTKTIIIIVACSVGGVWILAAAVIAVICKYQAYRRRYGNHELLLDNDDDDPLDIPA